MKIIESHSGLSALLVDKSDADGIWVSSLTHAAIKGLPDNECVPLKERVDLVSEINRISDKPIIVDVDTFGPIEHIPYYTHAFSRAGAYAVIMEDKKGTKQNSLLIDAKHELEDVDVFAEKIRVAKANTKNMKIFARLESLIAKRSTYEALIRAEAYLKAGADGIMVHSKEKVKADEVMEVGNEIRLRHPKTTLIAVPTTYTLPENHPFDIVIHANHLLRASLSAMEKYINGEEVELASVQHIFDLVGN
jgi:2-methylisocitrate lyase-like PEP mutase family enzyme